MFKEISAFAKVLGGCPRIKSHPNEYGKVLKWLKRRTVTPCFTENYLQELAILNDRF